MKRNNFRIRQALKILRRGGAVVFPTETLYALGAMAADKKAVKKVYLIKRRPKEKLLPVIVGSMEQAEQYFIFGRNDRALAKQFWPGPLSLVLKTRSKKLADALGSNMVAVRYSAHPVAAALARLSGSPITSTSANISGKPGCLTIAAAKRQFMAARKMNPSSPLPDFFFEGGALKKSLPSTIVQTKRDMLTIVREGKISGAKIVAAIRTAIPS